MLNNHIKIATILKNLCISLHFLTILSCYNPNIYKLENCLTKLDSIYKFTTEQDIFIDYYPEKNNIYSAVIIDSLLNKNNIDKAINEFTNIVIINDTLVYSVLYFRIQEALMRKYQFFGKVNFDTSIAYTIYNKIKNLKVENIYITLGNLIYNNFEKDSIVILTEETIQQLNIPIYLKAKILHVIALYYHYGRNEIQISYENLQKSFKYYTIKNKCTPDLAFLIRDIVQLSVANREYYLGLYYANESLKLIQINYQYDTILNNIVNTQMGYILYLNENFIKGEIFYNNAINLVKNKIYYDKVYQHTLYHNIYSLRSFGFLRRADSLLTILSSSSKYYQVNLLKCVGERMISQKQLVLGVKKMLDAVKFHNSHKYIYPGQLLTIYAEIQNTYQKLQKYDKSNNFIFKTISYQLGVKVVDVGNEMDSLINKAYYAFIPINKLSLNHYLKYEKSKNLDDLILAKSLNDKAINLISNEEYSLDEDRRSILISYSSEVYSNALKINYQLFIITCNYDYLQDWINVSEQNKGIIYLSTLENRFNKYSIPDSIVYKIKSIISQLKYLKQNNFLDSTIIELKNELKYLSFELNKRFKLKWASLIKSNIDLQSIVIKKGDCILSFDIESDYIYELTLLPESFNLSRITRTTVIDSTIKKVITLQNSPHTQMKDYFIYVNNLYNYLFSNYFKKLNDLENLYISLDENLNLVSVEAVGYFSKGEFIYLINRFSVSYLSQINKYFEQLTYFKDLKNIKATIFAFSDSKSLISPIGIIPELPGAALETQIIKTQIIEAKIYSSFNCTVDNFIFAYTSPFTELLHISTHGNSNSKKIDDVYMIMKSESKSKLDTIYGFDLFKYKSFVSTVIISACKTGQGLYVKGDNVFNLSRYFLSNGAKQVIYPLWEVNDYANFKLFSFLYSNAKTDGEIKYWLRKSKLELLNSNTKFTIPYYWADMIYKL